MKITLSSVRLWPVDERLTSVIAQLGRGIDPSIKYDMINNTGAAQTSLYDKVGRQASQERERNV